MKRTTSKGAKSPSKPRRVKFGTKKKDNKDAVDKKRR